MFVSVKHLPTSTATAYNVTLNVYLADYMTMIKETHTEPKENKITVAQDGTVITAEIARLTFSDPFALNIDVSLNLSHERVLEAENRVVMSEAIYNNRWGNVTDLMTPTSSLSLKADRICGNQIFCSLNIVHQYKRALIFLSSPFIVVIYCMLLLNVEHPLRH
ncbi:uncharacterized protein LOC118477372 [Aplysia californica]|uniref:Uncharacterized protein LOC118477372 n=1 Tax=Aplysia californica TaxID=6500 RepID=A0ABM1VQ85_APLCA|nr:uncharacterized protein LOC118477372 [Aplysia californica]